MPNKIIYEDYAVGARENAYCGANTTQLLDNGADVYNKNAIFTNTAPYHCAGFDNGGIDLTRDVHIFETGDPAGFVSSTTSNEFGVFTTPPVLDIRFGTPSGQQDHAYYSGSGITLFFNTHWCTSVTVEYYRSSTANNSTTYTYLCEKTYDGIAAMEAYLPLFVETFDRIIVTFNRSQNPYQRAMVSMVTFGKTREITKIHSLEYHKKLYFDCSDIAIGTLDAVFEADEEINILANQKILVYHKRNETDEYELIGTYWISSSERQTDVLYSFTAEDAFSRLSKTASDPYLCTATEADKYSVSSIASDITLKTNVSFSINNTIGNVHVRGFVKASDYRYVLANLCFSVGAFAKSDQHGSITVFSPRNDFPDSIKGNEILGESKFKSLEKTSKAYVTFTRYFPMFFPVLGGEIAVDKITTDGILIEKSEPISGVEVYVGGNAMPVVPPDDVSAENCRYKIINATTWKIYARTNTIVPQSGDVKMKIYLNSSSDTSVYRTKASAASGGEISYGKRPLYIKQVGNTNVNEYYFSNIAERVFSITGSINASVINGTLDVGDNVSIETKYSGTLRGTVTEITGDVGYKNTIQNVVITVWQ